MQRIFERLKIIGGDILAFRNIESYLVLLIGAGLIFIDIIDDAELGWQMNIIIAALMVLVFRGTTPTVNAPDLDAVLHDRKSFTLFRDSIRGAKTVWIYGPSAINVIQSSSDIKREVIDQGGSIRVLLQDPAQTDAVNILRRQLDKNHDLLHNINGSIFTLHSMTQWSDRVEWGLLPYNPGFSLVVIDPHGKKGRVIVEFFGFQNEMIDERMHLSIGRQESQYWFDYWVSQYEIMWQNRNEPEQPAPRARFNLPHPTAKPQ